ncbi:MAG TPA: exosortase/archaeosortase family protein [Pirellulales bacterium]
MSQFEIPADQRRPVATLGVLLLLLFVFYWGTLLVTSTTWNSPEYSHGWLVPLFAGVLLWLRREPIEDPSASARWAGLGILVAGLTLRMAGAFIGYQYFDMLSFLPCLFGIFLIVGGWQMLRWAGPALGFLIFMYPLPSAVSRAVLNPLQRVATVCSTYALQTLGIAAFRSGNVIQLGEAKLNVVEACSGLRMSTIFLAMAVAVTLVTVRPTWERIVIILSSVPIALLVNVIRITMTGVIYQMIGVEIGDRFFHGPAGWIMMPIAMGFLFLELQVLANLLVVDEDVQAAPVGMSPMGAPRARGKT